MEIATALLNNITAIELSLLGLNVILLLASGWIDRLLPATPAPPDNRPSRLRIFRLLNLLPILLILSIRLLLPNLESVWPLRIIAVLLACYLVYLTFHVLSWAIRARYAKRRQVGDELHWVDTYNTRLLILLVAVVTTILGAIAIIRILGFDSLLEAGGVIGVIGVMLALTQGAWAPDIIAGLIILNSRLLEEGDVIRFRSDGVEQLGLVFKTKIFHTEFLDLVNNHRRMIPNAQLRRMELMNLSKFASAKGLRESLRFNIGYHEPAERVRAVLAAAYGEAVDLERCKIEPQHEPEIVAVDAGDYAISWALFYYTKEIKSLQPTKQSLLETVLRHARENNLDLSTPALIDLSEQGKS